MCFPEELRDRVKLRNVAKIGGCYHIIPQCMKITDFGAIVGMGNTLDEAIQQAKDIAGQLEGSAAYVDVSALDDVHEELKKMRDFGMGII